MDGDRWPVEFFLSSSGLKMLLVEVQSEKSNKKTAFIIKQLSYLQLDRWILGLTVNAFMTFWHWCHMTVNGSDCFAMVYVVLMVQCGPVWSSVVQYGPVWSQPFPMWWPLITICILTTAKSRPRPIVSGARFRSFCNGLCGSISSSEMDAVTWISEEMLRRTE